MKRSFELVVLIQPTANLVEVGLRDIRARQATDDLCLKDAITRPPHFEHGERKAAQVGNHTGNLRLTHSFQTGIHASAIAGRWLALMSSWLKSTIAQQACSIQPILGCMGYASSILRAVR